MSKFEDSVNPTNYLLDYLKIFGNNIENIKIFFSVI